MKRTKIRFEAHFDTRMPFNSAEELLPYCQLAAVLQPEGYVCGLNVPEAEAMAVVMFADTAHFTVVSNRAIDLVMNDPEISVILAGNHITRRPQDTPKVERVFSAMGDPEPAILEILNRIKKDGAGEVTKNLSGVKGDPADINTLPVPDFSIMPEKNKVALVTCRGKSQASINWIIQALDQAIKQCVVINDKLPVPVIEILDPILPSLIRAVELDHLAEQYRRFPIKWKFNITPRLFNEAAALAMRKLELESVKITLDAESLNTEEAGQAFDLCMEYGLPLECEIMYSPEMEPEEIEHFINYYPGRKFTVTPVIPEMHDNEMPMPDDWAEFAEVNVAQTKIPENLDWNLLDKYPSKNRLDKVNIVIPVFAKDENAFHLFRRCIQSICSNTPDDLYDLTLVDNGSNEKTIRAIAKIVKINANFRHLFHVENKGFAGGMNAGYWYDGKDRSPYRFTCLLNMDTVVTKGWLENLIQAAGAMPQAGIISPLVDNIDSPSAKGLAPHGKNLIHNAKMPAVCWLVRRECFESVGGFDEEFWPGCYEDDWFVARARLLGWKTAVAGGAWIHHHCGGSHDGGDPEWRVALEKNRQRYIEKMKTLPPDKSDINSRIGDIQQAALAPYKTGDGLEIKTGNESLNGQWDWIEAVEFLERTGNPSLAICQMMESIKPGGHLLLICANRDRFGGHAPAGYNHLFWPKQVKKICEKYGEVVQINTLLIGRWSFDVVVKRIEGKELIPPIEKPPAIIPRPPEVDPIWEGERAALKPFLKHGVNSIEFGCGRRKYSPATWGIDLDSPLADEPVDIGLPLQYSNGQWDNGVAIHVIEHLEDTEAVLREWLRVIMPGGYLCLIVPRADRKQVNWPKDHKHEFLPTDFKPIAERVGRVVQFDTLNNQWSFDCVIQKEVASD